MSTYGNAVVVLLANALGFGLALLKRVLILELGTHGGSLSVVCGCVCVCVFVSGDEGLYV